MIDNLLLGLSNVLIPSNLAVLFIGLVVGIFIGALPGFSVVMGLVLFLPLTYNMNMITSILLLIGVFCGGVYGGSITAILIRTPGTPAAAATVLDGYEFAKRGEGGRAIGISTVSSVIGGLVSCIALMLISPVLAKVALKFSAAEYFSLAFFGLTIIGCISGKSIRKGLLSGLFGLLVATVGIDQMSGYARYTFGVASLLGGISMIPALIGLFAIPQVLINLEKGLRSVTITQKVKRVIPTKADLKKIWPISVVCGLLGTFIGSIPGTGATIASFFSYNETRRWSKHPEKFGTGIVEGVAAPESANNGVTGGAMIPLLTLAVPGDAGTAIMLGAFIIQGVQPGPLLFTNNPDIVYSIFVGLFFVNILMLILGLLGIRVFSKVASLPSQVLIPAIFVLCLVGSFAINNNVFDVYTMLAFGLIGYIFKKLSIPEVPMVIGIILGPMFESNFRRALILSKGSASIFFTSPISMVFIILSILTIFWPTLIKTFKKLKGKANYIKVK